MSPTHLPIRKAVFPVAGLGSRFLPATKAIAKEMLPVVDKPLIQYAVDEAVAAGITELIFVTGRTKRSIEDHFDTAYELETELAARGKADLLAAARDVLPPGISCCYVRQPQALGLGHAVLCAANIVGDEPFAVLLADDLIDALPGQPNALAQMVAHYNASAASVLAVHDVPREHTKRYGIVSVGGSTHASHSPEAHRIQAIVEKPKPELAPSTLGVVGRYVLPAQIFDALRTTPKGAGGEIQLTDGIATLIAQGQPFDALRFTGQHFDCGNKLGYLQATMALGLRHAEVGEAFAEHLAAVQKLQGK